MSHEPRSLVRHAQHAVKLVGAHPLLGRTEQMESQQPFVQGNMAVLKDRVDGDRELLFTRFALVHAGTDGLLASRFRGDLPRLGAIAVWADRAIRPAALLKKFPRLLCICEMFASGNVEHGPPQLALKLRFSFGFVKYIIPLIRSHDLKDLRVKTHPQRT